MKVHVTAVHPGAPTTVDTVVAGVWVRAEWVGAEPDAGDVVDVELDIDEVLRWADAITVDGAAVPLREGPLLRGTVEVQDRETLTMRVGEGLVQVETDAAINVPPGTAVALVVEHLRLFPTGT